jgi:prophage antirepressor-like protein
MIKETAVTKIAIFRKKEIRKTIHKNEWWFVVNDVVEALELTGNLAILPLLCYTHYIE